MLPLEKPTFCVNLGQPFPDPDWDTETDNDASVVSYSGATYDEGRDEVRSHVGGGHAATASSYSWAFSPSTLAVRKLFEPMPSAMMHANKIIGGVPVLDNLILPGKFWDRAKVGLPAPAMSPITRHTYTGVIYLPDLDVDYIGADNNATANMTEPARSICVGGNRAKYDPKTGEFADTGKLGLRNFAFVRDPVSGSLIALNDYWRVWNPGDETVLFNADIRAAGYFPAGGYLSGMFGSADALDYDPEHDLFVYYRSGAKDKYPTTPVLHVKLDRATGRPSFYVPTRPEGGIAPAVGTTADFRAWAYDPVNKIHVGGLKGSKVWGYKVTGLSTGVWEQRSLPVDPNGKPPLAFESSYVNVYVKKHNYFYWIARPADGTSNSRADTAFAFRWGAATPVPVPVPQPTPTPTPPPSIEEPPATAPSWADVIVKLEQVLTLAKAVEVDRAAVSTALQQAVDLLDAGV